MAVATIVTSIGVAAATAVGTFNIQKSKFKKDFEYDLQGIRTHKTAEDIARRLLEHERFQKRKFTTIRYHIRGFEDNQLRQILLRAGAVAFENKDGEEFWGLIERNEDKVFPKDEKVDD